MSKPFATEHQPNRTVVRKFKYGSTKVSLRTNARGVQADLKKFYDEHKADHPNGFEEAKGKIWRSIAQLRFAAWMEEMRKSVTVTH